jgi:hypothetical protein
MNEIQEYSAVAAMLTQIEGRYAGRVYDVTSKAGMDDAKVARREIRTTRTGLEKLRKELKEPALRRCQLIDAEAKGITQRLVAIEEPIDKMISDEEGRLLRQKQEAAQKEQLRVSMIRERIERFNVMPPWGARAAQISARLHEVNDIPVDATFEEFTETAAVAKAQAITRLSTLAEEARVLEAEQAKLKALAEEQAAKMAAERAEHEARLAEERAKAEAERQERIAAQKKLDEAAANERARMAEEARIAKEGQQLAEQVAASEILKAAEAAEEAEREQALADAKCESYSGALKKVADIVAMWLSDQIDAEAAMDEIEVIVTANA